MKEALKLTGITLGFVVVVGVVGFAGKGMEFASFKFWAPKTEAVRYDVQKQSQAHRDGLQRNLSSMQVEYLAADAAGKAAIKAAVRHQYSQADTSEFPAYLQTFLTQMGL